MFLYYYWVLQFTGAYTLYRILCCKLLSPYSILLSAFGTVQKNVSGNFHVRKMHSSLPDRLRRCLLSLSSRLRRNIIFASSGKA